MKFTGYAKEYAGLLALGLRVQDWLVTLGCGYLAFWWLEDVKDFPSVGMAGLPANYLNALIFSWLLSAWLFPQFYSYRSWRGESLWEEIRAMATAWTAVFVILLVLIVFTKQGEQFSRAWLGYWYGLGLGGLIASRLAERSVLRALRRRGINLRHIVLVGSGDLGQQVALKIRRATWTGLHIHGFFSDTPGQHQVHPELADIPDLGPVDEIVAYLEKHPVDQVWIGLSLRHIDKIRRLVDALHTVTAEVRLILDITSFRLLNHSIAQIDGIPVINMSVSPMTGVNRLVKWCEDKILAASMLLLLSPLLGLLALLVKCSSPGPVFYRQARVGWNGKVFDMLKFRTMPVDVETNRPIVWGRAAQKQPTAIGRWLRKTSLDELPQLINVLKGEMSLVGPRPERPQFVEEFKYRIPSYMQKHLVNAGMTGWAQINGWRGDTDLHKRIEYDLWYIEHWSLWLDMKILLLTVLGGFLDRHTEV